MPLKNYTTKVSAERTAADIIVLLTTKGAREILMEYDDENHISALSFRVETPRGKLTFRLPVNVEAVRRTLSHQWGQGQGVERRQASPDHARNVAWRILKDWVEAQMALLETEMVEMEQIFLPYMQVERDRSLYELMVETNFQVALPEGRTA